MIIAVTTDSHGSQEFIDFVNNVSADYILHCGDMEVYSDHTKPVYFVKGNHEEFNVLSAIEQGHVEFKNLRYIKNGEVIALKKGKEVIRILGYGGNHSTHFFSFPKSKLIGDRRRHYNKEEFDECLKRKDIDVLLTHETPEGIVFIQKGKRKIDIGEKLINELIIKVNPKYSFSGHHHVKGEIDINQTKCYALPKTMEGYILWDTEKGILEYMPKIETNK